MGKRYVINQLDELNGVNCPCGVARRGFTEEADQAATMHLVDITQDEERPHYHKRLTEIYCVLEGEGHLEVDGELVPLKPLTAVMIRPGCRHRAIGDLRIINVAIPAFDPSDEWFD